jgi:hypothetical protein
MSSSNLVVFQEALSETPIAKDKLLASIPTNGDFTPFAEMMVDLLCRLDKKVDTLTKTREQGRWVSRKALRIILLEYEVYLLGFELREDDKIYYHKALLDPNSSMIISLCQRLEDEFFPNKEISVDTMVTAIKAALIARRDKVEVVIAPELTLRVFVDYINTSGVRKKRKMPFKAMCEEFYQYSRESVFRAITNSPYLEILPNKNNNGIYIVMKTEKETNSN